MQVRESPRGPPKEVECKPGGEVGLKHADWHMTGIVHRTGIVSR